MPRLSCLSSEDQITHEISLDDAPEPLTGLDVFKVDPDYEEHEKQYKAIMREVLGEDEVSDDEGGAGGDKGEEGERGQGWEGERGGQRGESRREEGRIRRTVRGGGGGGERAEARTKARTVREGGEERARKGGDSVMQTVIRPISLGREVLKSVWALSS